MEEKNVVAYEVDIMYSNPVICNIFLKESGKSFISLDPSQEPIFPPKLKVQVHISITLTLVIWIV